VVRWRAGGLDRLVPRLVDLDLEPDGLVVRSRVSAANSGLCIDVSHHWTVTGDGLALLVEVVPSPGWDCTWPRVGVRFDLPATLRRAAWFGTGPLESYPDTRDAARVGRFEADINELNVNYSRPQETGHRAELRTLVLSDETGPRLQLATRPGPDGHRPGFTLTPHTPQELDRARHPYELAPSAYSYLFIDDAVHGIGSRACGVDVLPQYALWPRAGAFGMVFSKP
jgi:beta-galactosidase